MKFIKLLLKNLFKKIRKFVTKKLKYKLRNLRSFWKIFEFIKKNLIGVHDFE
jgi:hypothetical protein